MVAAVDLMLHLRWMLRSHSHVNMVLMVSRSKGLVRVSSTGLATRDKGRVGGISPVTSFNRMRSTVRLLALWIRMVLVHVDNLVLKMLGGVHRKVHMGHLGVGRRMRMCMLLSLELQGKHIFNFLQDLVYQLLLALSVFIVPIIRRWLRPIVSVLKL